jgi:hypothetical protein
LILSDMREGLPAHLLRKSTVIHTIRQYLGASSTGYCFGIGPNGQGAWRRLIECTLKTKLGALSKHRFNDNSAYAEACFMQADNGSTDL